MNHELAVRRASAFVLVVACIVLLGWGLDVSFLKSVVPGLTAMNPTTAVVFALAAGSLLVLQTQPASHRPSRRRLAAMLAALVVATVGVITLAGFFLGSNLGLDQILFGEELDGNRIAPNTGFNFVLVGLALLLLDAKSSRGQRASQLLACISGFIAFVAVVGYLYGVDYLYGVTGQIKMALNTAIAFAVLDIGILLSRPGRGVIALVTSEGSGAAVARRLLPATFAVPVAVGWVRLTGQRADLYGTEFGATLFTLTIALIFAAAVLVYAAELERAEPEKQRGEQARARLAAIVESSGDAITAKALDGTITSWNPGAERLYGYTEAEVIGQPTSMLVPPKQTDEGPAVLARVAAGEPVEHYETTRLTRDRRRVEVSVSISPIYDGTGRVIGASAIARDVSERKRGEEVLERTLRELEERTRALEAKTREQETFIYTVSHDLRAPLVSLQGLAGILVEDHATDLPEEARLYLDRIIANADKMQGLISDLLELSRVGYVEITQVPVDLGAVVANVVEQLGHTLAARNATVLVTGELPTVWANRAQLAQLFANLIANAVAYTPADRIPMVQFGAVERPDCWEITIRDNGVGIPATWQEKIFGLFQRLPAGKALNPGGSGVGLAIVNRIVETHRGRLWLESEEGVGTTFFVALPKHVVVEGSTSVDPTLATEIVSAA